MRTQIKVYSEFDDMSWMQTDATSMATIKPLICNKPAFKKCNIKLTDISIKGHHERK